MLNTVLRVAAPPRHGRALGIALALCASLITGCITDTLPVASRDSSGGLAAHLTGVLPDRSGPPLHDFIGSRGGQAVPMRVGDAWDYDVRTRYQITTADGPQPPTLLTDDLHIELIGTERAAGREYVVQAETWNRSRSNSVTDLYLYRQDAAGLYELDTPVRLAASLAARVPEAAFATVPPAQLEAFRRAGTELALKIAEVRGVSRGGGPQEGELTMLRYPLQMGSRWTVRADPFFGRIVEARQGLALPAGAFRSWRLRGVSALYGPNDLVYFFYSRVGLMLLAYHLEANVTDANGNVIGTVVNESRQELRTLHLAGGDEVAANDR